jgi:hypothetical protein
MTSRAGVRIALPTRSPVYNAAAAPTLPVIASSGTHIPVTAYPTAVCGQGERDRSTSRPVARRNTSAAASPAPVTAPTTNALAPSDPRYGPMIERAPS